MNGNHLSRRLFLFRTVIGTALLGAFGTSLAKDAGPSKTATPAVPPTPPAGGSGPYDLPALPYAQAALEPYISAMTLGYHHGKHHKAYLDKTRELAAKAGMEGKSLEEIVKATAGKADQKKLFNNAAQAWNHSFYWRSMKPKGGGEPTGALKTRIDKDFGSFAAFREKFADTATSHFASGWTWLVSDGDKLKVVDTHDADTPLARGQKPLLVMDVWEHAYYLDYQNLRKDYVKAWLDSLVNWEFAAQNLG